MARTFRMKSVSSPRNFSYIKFSSKNEILKYLHLFFGDRGKGERNAPAFFKRLLNRKEKAKAKQQFHCSMETSEGEDFVISKHYKNANWKWW
jgi:hypothetical protein